MPFTIHPDQKPSDDELFWEAVIAEQKERDKTAATLCRLHADNVRLSVIFRKG